MWAKTTMAILLATFAGGCANTPYSEPTDKSHSFDKRVETELDQAIGKAADGEYAEAAAEFAELSERYRQSGDREHAAAAMFWLGFCRERQGRLEEAREIYEQVETRYPALPAADQARRRLQLLTEPDEGEI